MADKVLKITIPGAKWEKAKEGFLAASPKSPDFEGTDEKHMELMMARMFNNTVRQGLERKAQRAAQKAGLDDFTA